MAGHHAISHEVSEKKNVPNTLFLESKVLHKKKKKKDKSFHGPQSKY